MVEAEKHCNGCDESWPADLEFFYSDPNSKDGLYYRCKACYREWLAQSPKRQTAPSKLPRISDGLAPLLTTAQFMGGPQP